MDNKNKFSSFRNLSYLFFSVIILSIIFTYYLFVVVKEKEKTIVARNFRVLDKIGQNLQARLNDNLSIAKRISPEKDKSYIEYGFKSKYVTSNSIKSNSIKEDSISINESYPATVQFFISPNIYFTKNFDKIFDDLRRTEIFTNYIIINDSSRLLYSDNSFFSANAKLDTIFKNRIGNSIHSFKTEEQSILLFSHPTLINSKTYFIIGIINESAFAKEKYTISENLILFIIVCLFIILICFPFLKSLLISPQETLSSTDMLATVFSLFMIFCIYTFLQIHLYEMLGPDNKKDKNNLRDLANKIETSFQSDLSIMYNQALAYDNQRVNNKKNLNQDFYDLKNHPINNDSIINDSLKPTICKNLNHVFWLDKNGNEAFRWTTDSPRSLDKTINFKNRNYFKVIQDKSYWFLSNNKTKPFYFEPVYSRTDGSYRGILSLPAKDTYTTVSISSELNSVQNIILPEELNYCLINNEGKVLFHSDENRNSNENILEEINNTTLKAAILSRTASNFKDYYMGKNCTFSIIPVENLPFFIITIDNKEFVGNINIQVFILTFIHVFLLFLFVIAILFVYIFLLRKNKIFTKQRLISFEELYPAFKNKEKDTYLITYNTFSIIITFFVSSYIYTYPVLIISLFVTNTICSTSLFIFLRSDNLKLRKKLIVLGYIYLFFLLDTLLWWNNFISNDKVLIEKIPLIIFIIIFSIQAVFIFILCIRFNIKTINIKQKLKIESFTYQQGNSRHYYKKYILMLITCFILIGSIPTFRLYQFFYNEEYTLFLKYSQLQLAKSIFDKSQTDPNNSGSIPKYILSFYNTILYNYKKVLTNIPYNESLSSFKDYLSELRLTINPYNKKTLRLSSPKDRDPSINYFVYNNIFIDLYISNLSNNNYYSNLLLRSTIPKYTLPSLSCISIIFFYSSGIIFLMVMYLFILFFTKRYFLLDFFPEKDSINSRADLTNAISEQLILCYPIRIIIVGVPRSGKKELVQNIIQDINNKTKELIESGNINIGCLSNSFEPLNIDLTQIDSADFKLKDYVTNAKGKFVVLQHFDYEISSTYVNKLKLDLIEELAMKNYHVIITTSVHPSIFIKSLRKDSSMFDTEDYINNSDYFNWSAVLSGYEIFIQPIMWPPRHVMRVEDDEKSVYRTHHAYFQYFHAMWSSLSRNEKFVLFDIAEDNIANYQNRDAILSLYNKGIIVDNISPRLIHESLRDFILTEINDEDIYKEKAIARSNSAWSKFRLPFLLVTLVILFFVYYTQKDTFNQIAALIAAFTALIPSITKLISSSFNSKNT